MDSKWPHWRGKSRTWMHRHFAGTVDQHLRRRSAPVSGAAMREHRGLRNDPVLLKLRELLHPRRARSAQQIPGKLPVLRAAKLVPPGQKS
jgi:hypothetical protein